VTEQIVHHMLSFDVEEYFHVQAAADYIRPDDWPSYAKRLPRFIDLILQMLSDHHASATFFVLGWVARHEPQIVRRIADAGHEIASHGFNHQMITRLTPELFRRDLIDSRNILQDLVAKPVLGYRAPTFSITRNTAWALDILADLGFSYDASVFPIRHDRYGVPDAPIIPHLALGPAGSSVLELPPLVLHTLGFNFPAGGGGYFRLLPIHLTAFALARTQRLRRSAMIYLHPWEFDPDQPILPMSPLSRFRHRINLQRTAPRLRRLLSRFHFASVQSLLPDLKNQSLLKFPYK